MATTAKCHRRPKDKGSNCKARFYVLKFLLHKRVVWTNVELERILCCFKILFKKFNIKCLGRRSTVAAYRQYVHSPLRPNSVSIVRLKAAIICAGNYSYAFIALNK